MLEIVIHPSAAATPRTEVRLGRGALAAIGDLLPPRTMALLVVDEALAGTPVVARLRTALGGGSSCIHVASIAAHEDEKAIATCERLWSAWIEAGAGRDAVVIALGGGLISDVAGFAAACLHRGVPWIVAPTTTLAMADAAIGGKTAVNTPLGKNLVGAVHHPLAVLADLDALAGLPAHAFADGFAEVIKAAVVGDAALLDDVEHLAAALRALDADAAGPLLFRALQVKAEVVSVDALECSRREILNFGHTVAHALEHATRHAVSHGRAVAAGLVAESLLAERIGRLPLGTAARVAAAAEATGIDWRPRDLPGPAELVAAMRRDKKVRAGEVRVALPDGLGRHSASPGLVIDPAELAGLVGREP